MENLFVSYSTIKNVLNKIPSYYISQGDGGYDLFSVAETEVITCHVSDIEDVDDFETTYKSNCTSVPSRADAVVLGRIANKIPFIVPKDVNGIPLTITQPRTGDEVIATSHNFCDKVTWFATSERVNDKSLTSSDGYVWESGDLNWVDMVSGRVQDDDGWATQQQMLNPEEPHGYRVIIKVDGYEKEMREPFLQSGGDYEVYWDDGYIKSFDDWTGKTVTASYSKAVNSTFILAPLPGKVLNIEGAEADFSQDVEMYDAIIYTVYGYASIFAPELGLPEGTKIPLVTKKYKRFSQLVNEALGAYSINEVYGSDPDHRNLNTKDYRRVSRGFKSRIQSIPFRYGTVRSLKSSLGLELRVSLLHDTPFEGDLATCTFYCTSQDE